MPQFNAADAWLFIAALGRRWPWLLLGGAVFAGAGLYCGLFFWHTTYSASAQLLRYETPHLTAVLAAQPMAPETFASLLRAPELSQRVAAQTQPQLSAESLAKNVSVTPERNSDVIVITASAKERPAAVALANLYATEAVRFTQELQTNAAAQVNRFVTQQLAPIEDEITALNKLPLSAPAATVRGISVTPSPSPSPFAEKLQAARIELADLLARYTDQYPLVREQRAKIAAIENQMAQNPVVALAPLGVPGTTNSTAPLTRERDSIFVSTKLQSLENARLTLLTQKQAAQTLEMHPPGSCQLLAAATPGEVIPHTRTTKVAVLAGFTGVLGLLFAALIVVMIEAMDNRLKTVADVKRVTRLPVVASAGNLSRLTETEKDNWAFRTWTSLQGLLSPSANQGFVCGITSSGHGEGRSTWVRLLADAASRRGFRVLTIVAGQPSPNDYQEIENGLARPEIGSGSGAIVPTNGAAHSILATPGDVTQKLTGPNAEPVVHIPLPGWVWNLERRKQWQAALSHWSQIDNIALLVELPPASMPETVLLAENLPNLIWLADARHATANTTREQLETLRHARCHLAGAVLNHAPVSRWQNRLARWFGCIVLWSGLLALPAHGGDAQPQATNDIEAAANTNLSFSVVTPAQRAAWQRRLTLGPGDVLTIALHGEPTLTRAELAVGPDGRISFAEAQDVLASGLTIDELRVRMNEELAPYRRAPETMITPVAFRSKKYYMLGKVMTKGVYTLDRPTTVLEAVARARGFETGLVDRNIIAVADFSRSFLVRGGKRFSLNFEKLFQGGDLSQNLSIEPGDYLYFPATNVKEVYVLGEVRLPGAAVYTPGLTLVAAISARAGYTESAWKGHVLVVRGSLNHPEAFVVDLKAILAGKVADFKLQPKDIVFVNSRPFIYGEELIHLAITAFLQSIVTATVGQHVIAPFQQVQ